MARHEEPPLCSIQRVRQNETISELSLCLQVSCNDRFAGCQGLLCQARHLAFSTVTGAHLSISQQN